MKETLDYLFEHLAWSYRDENNDGDTESPHGAFALVSVPTYADALYAAHDAQVQGYAYADEPLRNYAREIVGHWIVTGDSQGFTYWQQFDTFDAARREFQCRSEEYAEWLGTCEECGIIDDHETGCVNDDSGEEPDTCLNGVDGHWYVVTYGRAPYQIHAADCATCHPNGVDA